VLIEYNYFNLIKDDDEGDYEYKETTRNFNSKSSEVLKSLTQIKEYVNDIIIKFFESIVDAHGGSNCYFFLRLTTLKYY